MSGLGGDLFSPQLVDLSIHSVDGNSRGRNIAIWLRWAAAVFSTSASPSPAGATRRPPRVLASGAQGQNNIIRVIMAAPAVGSDNFGAADTAVLDGPVHL